MGIFWRGGTPEKREIEQQGVDLEAESCGGRRGMQSGGEGEGTRSGGATVAMGDEVGGVGRWSQGRVEECVSASAFAAMAQSSYTKRCFLYLAPWALYRPWSG